MTKSKVRKAREINVSKLTSHAFGFWPALSQPLHMINDQMLFAKMIGVPRRIVCHIFRTLLHQSH